MQPKRAWFSVSPLVTGGLALVILLAALVAAAFALADESLIAQMLRVVFFSLVVSGLFLVLVILNIRRLKQEHLGQEAELIRANKELSAQIKSSMSELTEERTQSKTILQSMSEAVLLLDSERIQYMNRALSRLTGYSSEDLIGKPLNGENSTPVTQQLAQLRKTVADAIAQGGIWQGPFKLMDKEAHELDVSVIGLPLDESTSHAGQILLLIRDNSLEKKLQAQKTNFVTNASHELRTPLASIKTRLYLLRKQPEKVEEHLPVMEEMTNQMQQLIEEMLDIGRYERGLVMLDRDNAVLQDLVNEAVSGYQPRAAHRSITLLAELAEQPIKVLVDQQRLVQVITNLISNAVNHTPQNGEVNVSVKIDPNSNGKKAALVRVQDNGASLSQDMLAQVFQPFASASQGLVSGTILGLSLAKEIVELHGGEITVESEASKGNTFTVKLPMLNS